MILNLYEIGVIKFGDFTLKSGIQSPFYIDLRLVISYPKLLNALSDALWERAKNLSFDLICGVPYTALPLATAISLKHQIPMIMRRKESKAYGTKKILEGIFNPGQKCLIVEDVITSGMSIEETMQPILHEGLTVKDILIVIDREQGGIKRLEKKGLHIHALFTLSEIMNVLLRENKIDAAMEEKVKSFISMHEVCTC